MMLYFCISQRRLTLAVPHKTAVAQLKCHGIDDSLLH